MIPSIMVIRNQGAAGLNFEALRGQLERRKIDCEFLEGDRARDHCLMKLTSRKAPGVVGFLEYENQGFEPRVVTLQTSTDVDAEFDDGQDGESLTLVGSRRDDVKKILDFVEEHFC
jgi:hypothetical protein